MANRAIHPGAALVVLLLATACGGEDEQMAVQAPAPSAPAPEPPPSPVAATPPTPPPTPSMLETQLAFEASYFASMTEPDKLIAHFSPDAVMWNIGEPPYNGREAILKGMRDTVAHVHDFKAAASRVWTKGNTLAIEYVMNATEGGKPGSISNLEIFTFTDDGLIVTDHEYTDSVTFMKQIGVYKGQKPAPALLPLPTAPAEMHNARNDATEGANAKAIVAANAAWLRKDDKAYLATLDDGITTYDMADNGLVAHDKKFAVGSLAAARKAIDFTAFKDVSVTAVEDFTIDEQEVSLTQKGDYSFDHVHMANTSKSATVHGVEIDQWKDGKIVKSWNWANSLELDSQLGTGPAAPAKPAAKTGKTNSKK